MTQGDGDRSGEGGNDEKQADKDHNERKKKRESLGDRWNRKRYEREEEALWGQTVKGSSVGISGAGVRGNKRDDDDDDFELSDIVSPGAASGSSRRARNPALNELHPPVVCTPRSREETRWMLQPLPSAKVMAGKVPSDRSGRASRTSTRSRTHSSRRAAREQQQKAKGSKTEKQHKQRPALVEQDDSTSLQNRLRGAAYAQANKDSISGQTGDLLVPKNSLRTGEGAQIVIDDVDKSGAADAAAPSRSMSSSRIPSDHHYQKEEQNRHQQDRASVIISSFSPEIAPASSSQPPRIDLADDYLLHNDSKLTANTATTNGSTSQPSSLLQPLGASTMSTNNSPASWAALLSEREKHFNLGDFVEREATADSGKAFTSFSPHAVPSAGSPGSDETVSPTSNPTGMHAGEKRQSHMSSGFGSEAPKSDKFNVDKMITPKNSDMAAQNTGRWSMDL